MCEVEEHYGKCRVKFFDCVCTKDKHTSSPHVCACGGSWDNEENIIEYPQRLVDGILNYQIRVAGEYSRD